jgi:hypothetical protein
VLDHLQRRGESKMSLVELGCCGAYCRTCPALRDKACRGCKLGYDTGERQLAKAKCRIKLCCMGRGYTSCADCAQYETCETIQGFFSNNIHTRSRHMRYKHALEFIREHGYDAFFERADQWRIQYGRLKP